MINFIEIRNFKAFRHMSAPLAPVTLVMGENGIGKSSICQAILAVKQSIRTDEPVRNLLLNGDLVKVGNGVDALHRAADEEAIEIAVRLASNNSLVIRAEYETESDSLPCFFLDATGITEFSTLNLIYLGADRLGPQLISSYSYSGNVRDAVDSRGTNALSLLYHHWSDVFDEGDKRLGSGDQNRTFGATFNNYLGQISKGASIELEGMNRVDSIAATFSFSKEGELSVDKIRPTNVGFGISYVSSIIVSCLLAKPGDVLVIENPEAHLHTLGQRVIAELILNCAAMGIQVICETHSREIFYWMRRLVHQNCFPNTLVSLLFVANVGGVVTTDIWHPVDRPFSELGSVFEQFLEYFGTPMDFSFSHTS